MRSYRGWLAASILQSDQTSRPIAALVGTWSADWIGSGVWRTKGRWAHADITLGDAWTALRQSEGLSILGDSKAIIKLAHAILGKGELPTNLRDLKLMRRLAGGALDDLFNRLISAGFAANDSPRGEGCDAAWVIPIAGPAGVTLKILCSQECLTAAARKTFTPTRLPPVAARPSAGFDAVVAPVAALLGRARLSIDALRSLEVGDVLVLDRPNTRPLELVVAGRPTHLRGTMTDDNGQLALKLQDLP